MINYTEKISIKLQLGRNLSSVNYNCNFYNYMLKQPITVTITLKESQFNYSYIKLNPTKLGIDRQHLYISFTTK